jgi:hypothetical protein
MRWVLAGLVFLASGCGSGSKTTNGDPPPSGSLKSLTVSPQKQLLVVDGTTPAVQAFSVTGTFVDGHTEDVTARAEFSLSSPWLGSFQGNVLTTVAGLGGVANVQAQIGDRVGFAPVTILIRQKVVDPSSGLPPGIDQKFGGADDPSRAPTVVYPNDGVLVPPNFGHLEVHFLTGAGNTVFEVGFINALTDVRVYTRCMQPTNGGCIFAIPDDIWTTVAQSNRGSSPVNVTVRGTNDSGSSVGSSKPTSLSVSQDDLIGALYYWTTSNGTGIMRFDFSNAQQKSAQMFAGPNMAGGKCIGCHALSRDGSKMVAEAGGQNDGRLLLLDVAKSAPLVPFGSSGKSIFESWSPSGDQFVGVYGDQGATNFNLLVFDGGSAATLMQLDGTGTMANPADHPDWSPDGTHIVYTRVGLPNTLQRMGMGAIEMVSNNGGWGMPVELVPAVPGKNHYYPAFAPDGRIVVYDESTCATGNTGDDCDADTDPTATLFAVLDQPGSTPVELARANGGGPLDQTTALTNSFPKWSPFVFHRTGETSSRLLWLTFSSSRHYGLRQPPASPGGETGVGSLIWMSAVDPNDVANGVDGSYPAFALPFQDYTTSNHIGQWTQQVVPPIQ